MRSTSVHACLQTHTRPHDTRRLTHNIERAYEVMWENRAFTQAETPAEGTAANEPAWRPYHLVVAPREPVLAHGLHDMLRPLVSVGVSCQCWSSGSRWSSSSPRSSSDRWW